MQSNRTERPWGFYDVHFTHQPKVKLKTLTVMPDQSLSMQRHASRAEYWFVAEGIASIYSINDATGDRVLFAHYPEHEQCWIAKNTWHQLCNEQKTPLTIIEIQYGDVCIEEDIERYDA